MYVMTYFLHCKAMVLVIYLFIGEEVNIDLQNIF